MDNNNPAMTPPPAPAAAPAPQPVVPPAPQEGGSKMMLWMIVGVVVILLVVGAIYFLLSSRQPAPSQVVPQAQDVNSTDNLEKDVAGIDVESADSSFTEVDTDLGSL